jgi:putative Holliday junction resolvase
MLPSGRRLAIDYGAVRVGTAISDASGIIASPLQTFNFQDALRQISNAVNEYEVSVVYIGLPLHLSGAESNSSSNAREFATQLKELVAAHTQLRLLDERLSTKSAIEKSMLGKGKVDRKLIDQLAAVEILEHALQIEKSSQRLAGYEVTA